MLKEKINSDYINAIKSKDTMSKNLLSVVKGEIQTIEKNQGISSLSDEEIIKILNKMAKSLRESIQISKDSPDLATELAIIEGYLPKQMTEPEIISLINELIVTGASNMGEIMAAFSTLPVDRKLVSQLYQKLK